VAYFVYILFSEKLQKFYTGTTDNVDERLLKHNTANYADAFTVKGIPWTLFLAIPCESSELAYQIEAFIKRMKSSSFIRRLKDNHDIVISITTKIKSGEIGRDAVPKPRD
jgi:putative endonuclease